MVWDWDEIIPSIYAIYLTIHSLALNEQNNERNDGDCVLLLLFPCELNSLF